MSEGCSVTLTELDTIYSFSGLVKLNLLLEIKAEAMNRKPKKDDE